MAQRVETGDGWELRLGDCLDSVTGLASLEAVDHVITDPPYSEWTHGGGRNGVRRNDGGPAAKDFGFGHTTDPRALGAALSIQDRWLVCFCDDRQAEDLSRGIESAGHRTVSWAVWIKPNGMPQMSGDKPAQGHEHMVLGHAPGRRRWNGGGRRGVWTENVEMSGRLHPTQKPLLLLESILRDFTDPGDLVCDPFAGSGTTGVACIRLGRRFIGWEKDPGYFETAVKRLRAARPQGDLFDRAGFDGKPQTLPGVT